MDPGAVADLGIGDDTTESPSRRSQAIALAEELQAALLLMVGVQVALERGLTTTGTLGVLVEAAQAGLTQIEVVLQKLQEMNFRATPGLYERALEMARLQPPVLPRRKGSERTRRAPDHMESYRLQ